MPTIINLRGDIGWEVTVYYVQEQLSIANGRDVDVHVSSRGGELYKGVDIYNQFRDYKRQFPAAQMFISMKSWVMSMASYIATVEGADLVAVEDNAVFMLHNPMMFGDGDYRAYFKNAEYLKNLADLMARSYANRSGRSIKEIREMMDEETYIFGEDIVKQGFADEVIKTESQKDKAQAIETARVNMRALEDKLKDSNRAKENMEKIAAMFKSNTSVSNASNIPATGGNNSEEIMDLNELKTKHPDLYAEAKKAGQDEAKENVEKEKARVIKLMEMKKLPEYANIPAVVEKIEESIVKGLTYEETLPLVTAVLTNPNIQAGIESPGAIATGTEGATGSGETPEKPKNKEIKEV